MLRDERRRLSSFDLRQMLKLSGDRLGFYLSLGTPILTGSSQTFSHRFSLGFGQEVASLDRKRQKCGLWLVQTFLTAWVVLKNVFLGKRPSGQVRDDAQNVLASFFA